MLYSITKLMILLTY